MGLNEFKVFFDRPNKTYFAGEIVNGQILINLNCEKIFQKIKIELVGRGDVHWTENKYDKNDLCLIKEKSPSI